MNNKCLNCNKEKRKKKEIKSFNRWFIRSKHKMNLKDKESKKIHTRM